MELQFCPLFSGSGGNSLYVACERTHLLVDAGVSGAKLERELSALGVKPDTLDGILITHEHSDHISGVGILSRRFDLPVFATEKTWAAMSEKLGAVASKNQRVFEAGEDFYLGEIDVQSFSTPHDAADPVGYTFMAGRCRASVATDLGAVRDGWLKHVEGSSLVLLESNHDPDMLRAGRYPYDVKRRILGTKGHLSNDEAGDAAVKLCEHGARTIVLGHLSPENNYPELAYESVAGVLRESGIAPGADVMLSVAKRDRRSPLLTVCDGGVTIASAL